MNITGGSTDVTTYVVMTLLADGTDATGLTITDLDLQYVRSGAAPAAKVDATALAATDSAHADNKAIEIDATDQPGLYRVDWPDAAFAAGVKEVILSVKHTTCKTAHLRVTIDAPVNVTKWNTTAVPSEHTAGYPVVTVKDGTGTGEINTNGGKVVGVELVDTTTTLTSAPADSAGVTTLLTRIVGTLLTGNHNPQSGDAYGVVNSGTHGNAALKLLIDAIGVLATAILDDTGSSGVVVAAGSKTGYALSATGSAALTEGYAATGAAPTLNQILYMIWALLSERSISSTTLTAKKLDGSTTAMEFTLNSATTPTTQTRSA